MGNTTPTAFASAMSFAMVHVEDKPHAHERMILEYHESRHKNGRLEEGSQAQPDDLPRPAGEAVQITARHAEHIERADRDLNEQNAAALEVGKEHLNDRVGHKNDTKEQHDGAGQRAEAKVRAVEHISERLDLAEFCDDVLSHIADASSRAGQPCGKGRLQRYGECIEPHGGDREKAHCKKALDDVERCLLEITLSGGVFNAALKGADHHADRKQRLGQTREKEQDGFHPLEFKEFYAHIAHERKKIAEEAYDLPVEPIHELI